MSGVVLFGYGARARMWHAALKRRRGLEAVAVVDPDPGAREAASAAGLAAHETMDAALGGGGAAIGIVASPSPSHASVAVGCLEAGLNVLVEKPLATSEQDARAVVEAAERAGRAALVGMNFRFRPAERAIAGAIERGLVGAPKSVTVLSARTDAAAGRGLTGIDHGELWEFVVHHVDLLRFWLGGDPEAVEARLDAQARRWRLRLAFPGGVQAHLSHQEGAEAFHRYDWIQGEEGDLASERGKVVLLSTRRRPKRLRPGRAAAPEQVLLGWADAALARGPSALPGDLTARGQVATVAAIEAAVRSAEAVGSSP